MLLPLLLLLTAPVDNVADLLEAVHCRDKDDADEHSQDSEGMELKMA